MEGWRFLPPVHTSTPTPSLCTQPEMVIIADDRLPVLNLIQDPLARADIQVGSFCGGQQSLIEQTVEETNVK